ncbi:MAG TPA: hypothetical protein VJT49_21750 [Amycolatopsis sp.]|uniref:hypothetical protein n=1 Tax=Amycolatopsis sp. TaxID=37632 RepID=UPI002B4592F3|nr:hypothetical protein [Amycolatopsis sp.]HKS47685.1 hypothetical protein [Amycolatopsis sp.]
MTSDEVVDEVGVDADEQTDTDTRAESPVQRYLVLGVAGFAAASLIVAAVFGVQWWVAASDDNLALAQARDEVLRAGTAAVKANLELDYTNPDGYFQKQLEISSTNWQQQVKALEDNARKVMATAKTKVTSTVEDIAVEELNQHDGKASLLAAASYVVNAEGQPPATKQLRLEIAMVREGQAWKLDSIGAVPTVTGGQ